jgi:vacuolar-type H+-ATPase subunit I/STV1
MSDDLKVEDPAVVDPAVVSDPVGDKKDEFVSKKELDAVVKESIARKQLLAKEQAEKEALRKQLEEIKVKQLKSNDNWKELAETKEKRVNELESENKMIRESVVNSIKTTALQSAAAKLGLHPSAVKYLNDSAVLDDVEIETTSTGRWNVLNADQVAQNFKATNPLLFQDPKAPSVNTTTPGVLTNGSTKITPELLNELSKKYQKSKSREDEQIYYKAVRQYQAQK